MKTERRRPPEKERGTLIVALMAGIAIVMIMSTVAVQNWADVVRRDNEAEMIFRAEDIVRGLKRYKDEKGTLPTELKVLIEPGNKRQYFLRKLWKDPLVKDGQWQLVYAAPGGGLYDPSVQQAPPGLPQQGSSGFGQQAPSLGTSLGTPLGSAPSASGAFPPIGGGEGRDALSADPVGMPIAGVKTKCTEKAFRKYKMKTEYKEWVFSIFDLEQRQPNPAMTGQVNPSFPPQQIPPPGQNPGQTPVSPPGDSKTGESKHGNPSSDGDK